MQVNTIQLNSISATDALVINPSKIVPEVLKNTFLCSFCLLYLKELLHIFDNIVNTAKVVSIWFDMPKVKINNAYIYSFSF